jgi:hypothetical protein
MIGGGISLSGLELVGPERGLTLMVEDRYMGIQPLVKSTDQLRKGKEKDWTYNCTRA